MFGPYQKRLVAVCWLYAPLMGAISANKSGLAEKSPDELARLLKAQKLDDAFDGALRADLKDAVLEYALRGDADTVILRQLAVSLGVDKMGDAVSDNELSTHIAEFLRVNLDTLPQDTLDEIAKSLGLGGGAAVSPATIREHFAQNIPTTEALRKIVIACNSNKKPVPDNLLVQAIQDRLNGETPLETTNRATLVAMGNAIDFDIKSLCVDTIHEHGRNAISRDDVAKNI